MKVDLQGVKSRLEEQLQTLEERKAELREQIAHIEATQRIVSALAEMEVQGGGNGRDLSDPGDIEGKAWFKRS